MPYSIQYFSTSNAYKEQIISIELEKHMHPDDTTIVS